MPPFILPLAVFVLLSLLSVTFSVNPAQSLWNARNLLIFLVVPVVLYNVKNTTKAKLTIAATASGAIATSLWGTAQVILGTGGGESSRRLTGFLGHYMTAGGELMLIALMLIAVFILTNRSWERFAALSAAAVVVIAAGLTQSRNVYLGLAAGIVIVLLLWRPAVVALLPFALSLAVLVSPPIVRERIFSIADVEDNSVQSRLVLIETGLAMVADFPLFGAGLQQAEALHPRYSQSDSEEEFPHLHNNILQIAAERGIPAAITWIWMFVALGIGHIRVARRGSENFWAHGVAAGAFACLVALFVAGMFEYNFGDSEVLMLFLLLVTLPFALEGEESKRSEDED